MKRLALIVGKQGSGKSTRVFPALAAHYARRVRWSRWLPLRHRVLLRPNYYNHVTLNAQGGVEFIQGYPRGRRAHALAEVSGCGRVAIELPHSGYLPAGIHATLERAGLVTHVFVLMLQEAEWRSFPGRVGRMTSPEYFMRWGPDIVDRAQIDYAAECARIRADVLASGLPATF